MYSDGVEQLPYYCPIDVFPRPETCHPRRSWLSGPGPVRDLAPLQAPSYVPPPTLKPSGGLIPETMADADNKGSITREEATVVSDFYRFHVTGSSILRQGRKAPKLPRGMGRIRKCREDEMSDVRELRCLVKRWKGFTELPSRNEAVARKHIFMKWNDAPDPINKRLILVYTVRPIPDIPIPSPHGEKGAAEVSGKRGSKKLCSRGRAGAKDGRPLALQGPQSVLPAAAAHEEVGPSSTNKGR